MRPTLRRSPSAAATAALLTLAGLGLTGCSCDASGHRPGFEVTADRGLFDRNAAVAGATWTYRLCVGDDPCRTAQALPGQAVRFGVEEVGTATGPVEFSVVLLTATGGALGGGSAGAEPTPRRAGAQPGCGRQPTIAVTVTADGVEVET